MKPQPANLPLANDLPWIEPMSDAELRDKLTCLHFL